MKTAKLAVIGKDVSQSLSPEIHGFIADKLGLDIVYDRFSLDVAEFDEAISALLNRYDGFNVTIPYKLSVIPHLKKLEGDAKIFGAVNTVVTETLSGFNTDGLGFMLMLSDNGIEAAGKDALVLGAGGAGRSAAKKLADYGANVFIYDRNGSSAKAVAQEFPNVAALDVITVKPYYLIVNATGIGMHQTVGRSPVGEELIKHCSFAVDLIYVPEKSRFLEIAESFGKKTVNGLAMLFYQAYYSDCIYFGLAPDETLAKKLFAEYVRIAKN